MNERRSKSIFIRDVMCPQCNCRGSMQILSFKQKNDKIEIGNSNRIRHYMKLVNGKPQFVYHSVSREYAIEILAKIKTNVDQTPDPMNQTNMVVNANQDDLNLKDSSLNNFTKNNYANALEKFS